MGIRRPAGSTNELDTGIAFATARGLTEIADWSTGSTLDPLIDAGRLDEALEIANTLVEHLQTATRRPRPRCEAHRRASTRCAAHQPGRLTTWHGWRPPAATPETRKAWSLVWDPPPSPTPPCETPHSAATLLAELAAAADTRDNPQYASLLPALIRTALAIDHLDIAHGFTTGYQPRTRYAHHALITATAALAEARGDHQPAADGYADAAERWEQFGVIPEHAYALLGHGRCLINLGHPHEAAPILHHARELFTTLARHPRSPRQTLSSNKPPR